MPTYYATFTAYENSSPMGTFEREFEAKDEEEATRIAQEISEAEERALSIRHRPRYEGDTVDFWCPCDELYKTED